MVSCKIKYFDDLMPRMKHTKIGDWVDVRASSVLKNDKPVKWEIDDDGKEFVSYNFFDHLLIKLGFAMQFPSMYEAHVLPRSSLFKNKGLILVNGMGIIDHSYRGDNDQWLFPALAMRPGKIYKHERIGQFRLIQRMEKLQFLEVNLFNSEDRGGLGSTGTE